ncbi:hypothetical protein RFI_30705 [Reticulomyxa filosa]|uniref:RanBP2-type domain-containing protein n=1 Tax=Reticulomyxa filosa TaxID=46433 RepID=X6LYH8_RETFI|nr:hypothetical protein RFI_30705 [Reticulomyxa filosa]|eukprot:ETO06689.1 hypothetical protein RFI_30705 [Reticulomyxa filosa]
MTADENAKKPRTEEAKSSKEREEKLKRDKAALEKGRLKREKQFKSDDDDENVAQQGEGLPIDKEAIRKQYSSSSGGEERGSGGNSRPSMNRRSWRCPICTLMNDPAVSHCARSMMLPSSNGRKGSLRSLFEDDNRDNGEGRVASKVAKWSTSASRIEWQIASKIFKCINNILTHVQENEVVQRILIEEFSKLKEITEDQIWAMSKSQTRRRNRQSKNLLSIFFLSIRGYTSMW